MEELRSTQKQLREERAEKQKAMEIKRIRIEQTEKKVSLEYPCLIAYANVLQMTDLKENIENEVHRAHDEYLKLESHIKLYITEMQKCL